MSTSKPRVRRPDGRPVRTIVDYSVYAVGALIAVAGVMAILSIL
jgi:hypothetical protein